MLGKIPDEEIARRTGRPIGSVSEKRRQLGLPKPNSQRKYWSAEEIRSFVRNAKDNHSLDPRRASARGPPARALESRRGVPRNRP